MNRTASSRRGIVRELQYPSARDKGNFDRLHLAILLVSQGAMM